MPPRKTTVTTVKAEASVVEDGGTFTFEDVTYTIPAAKDWPLEAAQAEEDGKVVTFVRELLGPEQWAKFTSKPRKLGDFGDFAEEMTKALGVDQGK